MSTEITLPTITEEEALGRLVSWLQAWSQQSGKRTFSLDGFPYSGHDLYIPEVIAAELEKHQREHARSHPVQGMHSYRMNAQKGTEPFYQAAWSLCNRGIIAPAPTYPNSSQVIGGDFQSRSTADSGSNRLVVLRVFPQNTHASLGYLLSILNDLVKLSTFAVKKPYYAIKHTLT